MTFDTLPRRIISLAPNITETIFSLHADSLLVGVTDFCDFPHEAKTKRSVGSYLSPDFESMISLEPDLAIMYSANTSSTTYKSLADNRIKVYISNAADIAGIKKLIRDIGILTDRKRNSDSIVSVIDSIANSGNSVDSLQKSIIIISANPLMTANGKTFVSEVCETAGFGNIFKDLPVEYPVLSKEELLTSSPRYLIIPVDTSESEKSADIESEVLKNFGVGEDIKVIKIDDDIMFRPGPRIVQAVDLLRMRREALP